MLLHKQLLIISVLFVIGCATSTQFLTPLGLKDKEYDFMGSWVSKSCVQLEGRELLWMKMQYDFTTDGELIIQAKHYIEGRCIIPRIYSGNGRPPTKSFVILKELMVDKGLFSKGVPGTRLRVFFGRPPPSFETGAPDGLDIFVVVIDKKKLCSSNGITFGDTGFGASTHASSFINYENCIYRNNST